MSRQNYVKCTGDFLGNCPDGEMTRGQMSRGGICLGENSPGEIYGNVWQNCGGKRRHSVRGMFREECWGISEEMAEMNVQFPMQNCKYLWP